MSVCQFEVSATFVLLPMVCDHNYNPVSRADHVWFELLVQKYLSTSGLQIMWPPLLLGVLRAGGADTNWAALPTRWDFFTTTWVHDSKINIIAQCASSFSASLWQMLRQPLWSASSSKVSDIFFPLATTSQLHWYCRTAHTIHTTNKHVGVNPPIPPSIVSSRINQITAMYSVQQ